MLVKTRNQRTHSQPSPTAGTDEKCASPSHGVKKVLFNWATLVTVPGLPDPRHSPKGDTEKEHVKPTECSFNAYCYDVKMQAA